MSTGTRIPRSISGFSPYISLTSSYLVAGTPTNASRLGLTEEEVATWCSFNRAWAPLLLLYNDKKSGRTTTVIDQMHEIIEQLVAFDQANHILDRIASSVNANVTDFETFNIKSGPLQKNTHSVPVTPFTELVIVNLQPLGGGSVSIKCFSSGSQRASILEGANCVQFVYLVGTTPPLSAEVEGLTRDLSTRASFVLSLGSGSSAKYLYIYFRWYNTKYPELAGPWNSLSSTLLL
jgi:hypothetical protein